MSESPSAVPPPAAIHVAPNPSPSPYSTPAPTTDRGAGNPLALAALICGAVAVVVGVVNQLAGIALLRAANFDLYGLVNGVVSVLVLLLALAALILGLVASRRSTGRLRAGIGIGIGAAVSISIIVGFAVSAILSLS